MNPPTGNLYGWVTILGILIGAILWHRRWKNSDPTLFGIFVGGMIGAFFGAKIIYFLAEGWLHIGKDQFWWELGYGKTIIGALLGGYGGVEFTKYLINYRKPTGDWFAYMVPAAIIFGRLGCLQHGCCLGKPCSPEAWYSLTDKAGIDRWPASPIELIFNLLILTLLFQLRRFSWTRGQLFHVYLISYGLFRFVHEFARDTPKIIGGVISGYQIASLILVALALWRFLDRHKNRSVSAG